MRKRDEMVKKKRKLDDKIHQRITALSKKGDTLAEKNDYSTALQKYWEAWDL